MMGGDSDVCGAGFDHGEYGTEHASNGADLLTLSVRGGRDGEVIAEEFVCSVDKMDVHAAPGSDFRCYWIRTPKDMTAFGR
jgi:hypothetical protein